MGLPLFPGPRLGSLPVRFANLPALLEDLFHDLVAGKGADLRRQSLAGRVPP